MTVHKPDCQWNLDTEHCTCGALFLVAAYRFDNGNVMAFDQHGHQMPYYQTHGNALDRITADYPGIGILRGSL